MNSNTGRSIELFYVNDEPDGMVTATIPFQWSGHVLVSNRTQIKEALSRSESERPGVYMLVGEKDGEEYVYIGETDEIRQRLSSHASTKDWWSTAIIITSSGEPLNKAHTRYLESRLLADAKRAQKIELDNGQFPQELPLSETARSHMDNFLSNIHLVLPALRFDFLLTQISKDIDESSTANMHTVTYFTLSVPSHGLSAKARLEGGKFIVEKGSVARKEWVGSKRGHVGYSRLFAELVNQGILSLDGEQRVFSQSYAFESTSAAAAVITGRPTSGPGSWLVEGTQKYYGDWEKENLATLNNVT